MLCLYYHKLQTLQTACLSFKTSGSQATCTPWVQSQTEKMVSSVILFAVRYSVQDVLRIALNQFFATFLEIALMIEQYCHCSGVSRIDLTSRHQCIVT